MLVGSLEGGKDGVKLRFGVRGKLDAVRAGTVDDVVEVTVFGVACSPFPRTTIATTPNAHNPMISTIPKHNHLPPGVRVSGKQFMSVVCGTLSSSTR